MNPTIVYRQALQASVHLKHERYTSGVSAALGLLEAIRHDAEMAGADKDLALAQIVQEPAS